MNKYHVSILDSDTYKFTMQNMVCRLYPTDVVRYELIIRDGREFPDGFAKDLRGIINDVFCPLYLRGDEKDFLRKTCYYLNPMYLDFLHGYRYDPSEIIILEQKGPNIRLVIEGYWYRTILWEVPLMATISELYFDLMGQDVIPDIAQENDKNKFKGLSEIGVPVSEFGARRRHSYANHVRMFKNALKNCKVLTGTSNVHLAMENNLSPHGTHAHEIFMFHGAKYGYQMATQMALDAWSDVYQGDLGTALTDTYTTDVFFRAFGMKHAKLYDGVRQDSGNPMEFATKAIRHYRSLKINPLHKTAIFSNAINSLNDVREIKQACEGQIQPRVGIGTWLSNDLPGVKPLNMVIKMTGVLIDGRWVSTVKLSDDYKTKKTGSDEQVRLCMQTLGIGV